MPFADAWAPYFQAAIRMRGRAYFDEGRVRQIAPQPGELARALVRGSEEYVVSLRRDHGRVSVACTCAHFDEGHYCKHIWAALLDVDEHGPLTGGPAPTPVKADGRPRLPAARRRQGSTSRDEQSAWSDKLSLLRAPLASLADNAPVLPNPVSVRYVIDQGLSTHHNGLVVVLHQRGALESDSRRARLLRMDEIRAVDLADPIDRELCALITGGARVSDDDMDVRGRGAQHHAIFRLPAGAQRRLLRQMIATQRCFLRRDGRDATPMRWDDGPPWRLRLVGELTDTALELSLELWRSTSTAGTDPGELVHAPRSMSLLEPTLILGGEDGLLIRGQEAAAFDDGGAQRWVTHFRDDRRSDSGCDLSVPLSDVEAFLDRLYMLPNLPTLLLPPAIARTPRRLKPAAHIEFAGVGQHHREGNGRHTLTARVFFAYGQQRIRPGTPGDFILVEHEVTVASEAASSGAAAAADTDPTDAVPIDADGDRGRTLIQRDHNFERQALGQLGQLGLRPSSTDTQILSVPGRSLAEILDVLLHSGWSVSADEQSIRQARAPKLSVASGIDWLELRGQVHFDTAEGGQVIDLARIVSAARSGKGFLALEDGSLAAIPTQWLNEHALLTSLGQVVGDHLRFSTSQAALLDALLAGQETVDFDERFREMRARLSGFDRVEPLDAAATFHGKLRTYQREGVGWLKFLRWFGLGGILADDMGLGKTIQVLAMLDARYGQTGMDEPGFGDNGHGDGGSAHRPSLVVAPRSVIFNWVDEARRFTPHLRVAAYAGAEREAMREAFDKLDLVVTSYGLLRRDVLELRHCPFDYVILDEAQAIKNPKSQSAKAGRLLDARHRLALTGTPVENHLGDLWSIFEFLNPGMLGQALAFSSLVRTASTDRSNLDLARQAGRALRPFILRRTKKQVLAELPDKIEQTIVCQMDEPQRAVYNQLRDHYRRLLLKGDTDKTATATSTPGFGGSTMLVLEALLRLRQAACHPALIDDSREDLPSAKLDVLVDQLVELIDEQHKALVFSQFTSLLTLVRKRLDAAGITYEYLDGRTRDREQRIAHFQQDEACPVFLISLKAGGLGLNLTAADYVFLLDPWWNPAVEQQAIDRAHRIGQTRHVFAYRLICEDTVEQRIAELQQHKKELADAVIADRDNILRHLTREDLETLLS